MKKHLKRMIVGKKGSISIFAAIIILPIFLLNALFIDTLRILSADRQLENAIESSLRSVMSYYDPDLSSVGLFSYAGSNIENQFIYYLERQFPQELDGYMNLTIPEINNVNVKIHSDRNLVNPDVFRHQVLESSKYQAPVQIGKDFFELFKSAKGVRTKEVEKMNQLVKDYEKLIELIEKRNSKIESAIRRYGDIKDIVEKKIPNNILGSIPSNTEKVPDNIESYGQLIGYFDRYKELLKKKNDEDESLTSSEEREMKSYERAKNGSYLYEEVETIVNNEVFFLGIKDHLVGIGADVNNPFMKSAAWYNKEINKYFEDSPQLREEFKDFIIEDKFFAEFIDNLENIREELISKIIIRVDGNLPADENYLLENHTMSELYLSFYIALNFDIENSENNVGKYLSEAMYLAMKDKVKHLKKEYISKIDKRVTDFNNLNKKLNDINKREKKQAEGNFSDLWKLFSDIYDMANEQEIYDELEGYVKQYNGWAEGGTNPSKPGMLKFFQDAFDRYLAFVEFAQKFPDSFRNEIYINEYILANYGTSEPYDLVSAESFKYENKKAEYITYGYHAPAVNYTRFLLDITLILLVVNFLEHVKKGSIGGPYGYWVAIGLAFSDTVSELTKLTSNGELRWNPFKFWSKNPSKGVDVDMKMFLRIMMIVRSSLGPGYNDGKLRRLQAVVSRENKIDLIGAPSYVEGEVEAKVDLLFIPALMRLLPNNNGGIQGNHYTIKKKKVYSY